jgi:broad specificity phosphatase PhoE
MFLTKALYIEHSHDRHATATLVRSRRRRSSAIRRMGSRGRAQVVVLFQHQGTLRAILTAGLRGASRCQLA